MIFMKKIFYTIVISGILFSIISSYCLPQSTGEKWAVIIGINKYKDHNLLPLKYPEHDAKEFKRILVEHSGVPEDNIKFLIDKEATKANIKHSIYEFLGSRTLPEDEVYIFFSGYGTFMKDKNGDEEDKLDECLIPYDGKITVKDNNYITDDELGNWLSAVKSRNVVLIFDSEKSSGMNDFIDTRGGITLISSAGYKQIIREESSLEGGTLMHFFAEAIEGDTDEKSNEITLVDIFLYVKEKVQNYAKTHNYELTPIKKGKTEKEIVFYRNVIIPWEGSSGLIAFTSDSGTDKDIYIMNSDGTRKVNITRNKSDDFSPAWSPDGKKLAFISNRTGNFDIFSVDFNGKNLINLTESPENNYMPSWSFDSSLLAYTVRNGDEESIFTVSADGSQKEQITTGTGCKDVFPRWSPVKNEMAFISNRTGQNEIYIARNSGTELINITDNRLDEYHFLWSPDGKKIAFLARYDGQTDLYIMNSDGSMQENLTSNPEVEYDFSWSPDGKKLACTATENEVANVFIINIYDGKVLKLTDDDTWKRNPVWSPDSSRVIYCSGTKIPTAIYGINSDGTDPVKLVGGNTNNYEPVWSNAVDLHL